MLIPQIVKRKDSYGETDWFFVALLGASIIHAVVILGISFGGFKDPIENKLVPRMEVTLVNTQSDQAPKDVDFFAQANQEGGGNVEETVRPETAFVPLIPEDVVRQTIPNPPSMSTPEEKRATRREVMTSENGVKTLAADVMPVEKKESKQESVAEIINRSMELASLEVELGEIMRAYAKMPRRKFITAATKEYKYASYMESWRRKVEKIGNLNIPKEAKNRNLSGNLILDVAINSDGSIRSLKIARSSGHKVLDDAALRIVHLAAPYAPLPPNIKKETDILHITRTWKFLGDDLSTSFN